MSKFIKILLTIIIFIIIMFLICFLISLCFNFTGKIEQNEILTNTGSYFSYIVGHDYLDNDFLFKNILALIGVVSLALLSAHLTVNLFWRLDDVKLEKNILIDDKKKTLTFTFKNTGRDVCNLKLSFILYDKKRMRNLYESKEYSVAILLKNIPWNLTVNYFDNEFWYKSISNLVSDNNMILCCIYSFVDTNNGQETFNIMKITHDNLIRNGECLESNDFFKAEVLSVNDLQQSTHNSNIEGIKHTDSRTSIVKYNFTKPNDNDTFAMVFYKFHDNPINLAKYNKHTAYLSFSSHSNVETKVTLEIKDTKGGNYQKEFTFDKITKEQTLHFSEIHDDIYLEEIREICFTVLAKNNIRSSSFNDELLFEIGDLLIYPL